MKKLFLLLVISLSWNCGAAITTNKLLSAQTITNLINTSITNALGTNFAFSSWRWIDVLSSGITVGGTPSLAPAQFEPYAPNVYGWAFYYDSAATGDIGHFAIQGAHTIATTNAANPNLYFNPHAHLMVTNIATGTNATFVLNLYYGSVWGYLTNYYATTNTCSFTNANQHGVVDFGFVTNNSLSGKASVIFKGRVMRINGGTGSVGANPVWLDSLDIHIPIDKVGSGSVWGN